MKSYKDYAKVYIGDSDIASLTLSSDKGVAELKFSEDGRYDAYIINRKENETVKIGDHYRKVYECNHWLKIFDDEELTFNLNGKIKIYRAGDYGCVIENIF